MGVKVRGCWQILPVTLGAFEEHHRGRELIVKSVFAFTTIRTASGKPMVYRGLWVLAALGFANVKVALMVKRPIAMLIVGDVVGLIRRAREVPSATRPKYFVVVVLVLVEQPLAQLLALLTRVDRLEVLRYYRTWLERFPERLVRIVFRQGDGESGSSRQRLRRMSDVAAVASVCFEFGVLDHCGVEVVRGGGWSPGPLRE